MEHTALLYFVGPAGAGKSTLVATLQEWMQHQRYDGVAVNLDPGAETVPYQAAIDVREKFTLKVRSKSDAERRGLFISHCWIQERWGPMS